MRKLHQYIFLASLLLLLSWSDLSKYCRHQITDLKFRVSHMQVSLIAAAPDTVGYATNMDNLDTTEIVLEEDALLPHGEGMIFTDIDPEILSSANALMDSSIVPKPLTWEIMKDVKYKKKYNKAYDQYFDYPVFGGKIKAFDGQKVIIKGYIIPIDVGLYALSKNPYASCFFCGGAGPETISGLNFAKSPKRYKTDEFLNLQGVFRLNSTDINKFMYELYEVEVVQ
jgi:hypothetical protein